MEGDGGLLEVGAGLGGGAGAVLGADLGEDLDEGMGESNGGGGGCTALALAGDMRPPDDMVCSITADLMTDPVVIETGGLGWGVGGGAATGLCCTAQRCAALQCGAMATSGVAANPLTVETGRPPCAVLGPCAV